MRASRPRNLRAVCLLVALAGCATTGRCNGQTPCWETAPTDAFALPAAGLDDAGASNITRLLQELHTQECADTDPVTPATWHQKCAAAYQQVMLEHCAPAVDAWCDAQCGEQAGTCRVQQRGGVVDACARGALPGFRLAMPYCTGLELTGNNTFAVPDGGAPTCP